MNLHSGNARYTRSILLVFAMIVLWIGGATMVYAQEQPAGGSATGGPPKTADAANRFDLSVNDMELAELLKMVAANSRVSIVSSSDVSGKVSVNFYGVTLDEALDAILTVNGLTFTRRGGVIHVFKPAEVGVQMAMRSFELAWADPEQVVNVLSEIKNDEGTVVRSEDSSMVFVRDKPDILEQMADIVKDLDRKPRQVLITTWIVELNDTDLEKLGINWSALDRLKVFEFTGEASYQRTKTNKNDGVDFTKAVGTVVDLKAGILAENQFNLLLNFYETLTQSKIVSEPRVMTLSNKSATIVVGTIVPIPLYDFAKQTGVRILSGFQEQRIGTEIIVTPRVHADNYITLHIKPKVEKISDWVLVNGEKQRPIVLTTQAETTVMVKSGDIVVIGGLRDTTLVTTLTRVPLLHKIPLIGWLFKNTTQDNQVKDLTIFIKPELFDEDNPLSVEERTRIDSVKPMPVGLRAE